MKEELKYIAWIIVAVAIATVVLRVTAFLAPEPAINDSVVISADSGFVPIVQREYKPPSTPFERSQRPDVRLPRGTTVKDIKRTVIITKSQRVQSSGELIASDTTRIIELKSGELLVQADNASEMTVQQTLFVPPILGWGWFSSAGVSIGRPGSAFTFSPSLAAAPLEIAGTAQFPLVLTDLQGLGTGVGFRYSDFVFAAVAHWGFGDVQRQYKFVVLYPIN